MSKNNKTLERVNVVNTNRIRMLADRLSILLVTCNARGEDNWNPWALDSAYDAQGSMGESIRSMKDYETAKTIVRSWITKVDQETRETADDEAD